VTTSDQGWGAVVKLAGPVRSRSDWLVSDSSENQGRAPAHGGAARPRTPGSAARRRASPRPGSRPTQPQQRRAATTVPPSPPGQQDCRCARVGRQARGRVRAATTSRIGSSHRPLDSAHPPAAQQTVDREALASRRRTGASRGRSRPSREASHTPRAAAPPIATALRTRRPSPAISTLLWRNTAHSVPWWMAGGASASSKRASSCRCQPVRRPPARLARRRRRARPGAGRIPPRPLRRPAGGARRRRGCGPAAKMGGRSEVARRQPALPRAARARAAGRERAPAHPAPPAGGDSSPQRPGHVEDLDPEPGARPPGRGPGAPAARSPSSRSPQAAVAVFRPDLKWLAEASGTVPDLDVLWLRWTLTGIAGARHRPGLSTPGTAPPRAAKGGPPTARVGPRLRSSPALPGSGWQSFLDQPRRPTRARPRPCCQSSSSPTGGIARAFGRVVGRGAESVTLPPNDALHRCASRPRSCATCWSYSEPSTRPTAGGNRGSRS